MSLTNRKRIDFFDAMTPAELRDAWIYLVGSWPEAVDDAIAQVKRLRKPSGGDR
jgi:hypothetical protein